jgi:hypothetical protein
LPTSALSPAECCNKRPRYCPLDINRPEQPMSPGSSFELRLV